MPVADAWGVGTWLLAVIAAALVIATIAPLMPRIGAHGPALMRVSSAIACTGITLLGLLVITSGSSVEARVGEVLTFALVSLTYDGLSAPFLIAFGIVGAAASVYDIGYGPRDGREGWPLAAYPLFLASLLLVFGADDAFAFLVAWEFMALSSAALVVGRAPGHQVARTGYLYLALTHLATAALVIAFGVLAGQAGTTGFHAFREAADRLPSWLRDGVFLLVLVGFGTKAGAMPLHIWLPRAHPVAPSPVSALMSGVMIKAGVYGLVRVGLEVLGPGPAWWGLVVVAMGAASAVLGVLYALMEHDTKRLLAFHSIENIGIILLGVGVAMLASGAGLPALAGLGLAAALFHSLNHALFKSLLFLAAGAVHSATGARDLDRLGGLARLMPWTTLAFVVGAAAISGVPPLNGFASEWLTFQALIGAAATPALGAAARGGTLIAVGALALTAALAVACFVKAGGIAFLGLPRSPGAASAREVTASMRVPMAALAALCAGVGILGGPIGGALRGIADGRIAVAIGGTPLAPPAAPPGTLADGLGGAMYGAAATALLLVGLAAGAWWASERRRPVRRSLTWTCGIAPGPGFGYTATSYAKLIRIYFGWVLRAHREVHVEYHAGTPFPRTVRYQQRIRHVVDERLYRPLHALGVAAAQLGRRLQNGSLQLYLGYTVAALVVLLWVAR
jgi:hydrogenase-4 component B